MGVVLLLFIIGLELLLWCLWVMCKLVFGVGLLQVLLIGLVIGIVVLVGFDQLVNSVVVFGLGLVLLFIVFGLQIFVECKEFIQFYGCLVFVILLFQDIVVILLIVMILLFSGVYSDVGGSELIQIFKVVGSIVVVVVGGCYLLCLVFCIVVQIKLQDMFIVIVLLVVMGIVLLMELVGVFMVFGVFFVGLLLVDLEYCYELEVQIELFKGLLFGLFFISVGMSVDISLLFKLLWMVFGLIVLLIVLKVLVLYFVGCIFGGFDKVLVLCLGVVLVVGGEFVFVVFKMVCDQGLFQNDLYNLLVFFIILLMVLILLLVFGFVCLLVKELEVMKLLLEMECIDNDDILCVVIVGVGCMGQIVVCVLCVQCVLFIVLDILVEIIELICIFGVILIFYGDLMCLEIFCVVQVEKVEFFVIVIDDLEINIEMVKCVCKLYLYLKIIVCVCNCQYVYLLFDVGVELVCEIFFFSLEMSCMVFCGLGLSEEQVDVWICCFCWYDEEVLVFQYLFYNDCDVLIKSVCEVWVELEMLFQIDQLEDCGVVVVEILEKFFCVFQCLIYVGMLVWVIFMFGFIFCGYCSMKVGIFVWYFFCRVEGISLVDGWMFLLIEEFYVC